jgi:hypothetical protein
MGSDPQRRICSSILNCYCLYAKSYENFDAFQAAMSECIEQAPTEHKEKWDS